MTNHSIKFDEPDLFCLKCGERIPDRKLVCEKCARASTPARKARPEPEAPPAFDFKWGLLFK